MLQKTLALLHRSLRTDVRLLRMHLFRGGLIVIVLLSLWQSQSLFAVLRGSPGLELFSRLMGGNFWFITLATGFYFATAVTEEKEEQTLGLLRLAGISPAALLLGKWLPRVIGGLLLIAIQVPFTLLSITLGGVLIHQVLAAYCTLAAYLVLCGSMGLFASVVCSRSGAAVTFAFILLSLFFIMMPVWDAVIAAAVGLGVLPAGWLSRPALVNAGAWHLSALQRLQDINVTGFDEPLIGFQVISNVVLALLLGVGSWLLFDFMTRNETAAIGVQVRWIAGLTRLGKMRSRRAWSMPIVWKDFYQFAGGGWTVVKFLAYPVLMLLLGLFIGSRRFTADRVGGWIVTLMLGVVLIDISVLVSRTFRDEVKAQTWPLLVLLPRSLADVCYAKLAAGLLCLAPAVFYFLIGAVIAADTFNEALDSLFDNADALLLFTYVALQFVLFWHMAALLSIVWRWAAWPLALFFAGVFVLVGNGLLIACVSTAGGGPGSAEALLVFLCFIAAGLVFAVHVWIGMALERVAGE